MVAREGAEIRREVGSEICSKLSDQGSELGELRPHAQGFVWRSRFGRGATRENCCVTGNPPRNDQNRRLGRPNGLRRPHRRRRSQAWRRSWAVEIPWVVSIPWALATPWAGTAAQLAAATPSAAAMPSAAATLPNTRPLFQPASVGHTIFEPRACSDALGVCCDLGAPRKRLKGFAAAVDGKRKRQRGVGFGGFSRNVRPRW